jgi:hypothetical protein
VAEWLGTGLQNQLQRFESARNLRMRKAPARDASWGFLVAATWKLASVVDDAKKAKGFAQQRTGAFLLTFGDPAVRRAKRRLSATTKNPEPKARGCRSVAFCFTTSSRSSSRCFGLQKSHFRPILSGLHPSPQAYGLRTNAEHRVHSMLPLHCPFFP